MFLNALTVAHLFLMTSQVLKSLMPNLGFVGWYFWGVFYSNLNRTFCKQTEKILSDLIFVVVRNIRHYAYMSEQY